MAKSKGKGKGESKGESKGKGKRKQAHGPDHWDASTSSPYLVHAAVVGKGEGKRKSKSKGRGKRKLSLGLGRKKAKPLVKRTAGRHNKLTDDELIEHDRLERVSSRGELDNPHMVSDSSCSTSLIFPRLASSSTNSSSGSGSSSSSNTGSGSSSSSSSSGSSASSTSTGVQPSSISISVELETTVGSTLQQMPSDSTMSSTTSALSPTM
ncbi:uncharacterized protein AMSG_03030 [Thecamonas trahens ATCC 50062]|uniref:Uncharacterized protein n=1 Tax=Thecamonas trahens ATCC 50062 TaxID=461836 RepID=A0A0L0D5L8_THETB|nr:hypothetical protein AMSG_03030 [Thecamonas trahens ATCC 50062]KNC46593.1 hypothetical protein AMSG_03030 [Thecamonas trahens ATCC 50062]|eukprot:XP_013760368.1 hypothetical protein AMSG_03030 [Thecamonas trahens ATCC 50062]